MSIKERKAVMNHSICIRVTHPDQLGTQVLRGY